MNCLNTFLSNPQIGQMRKKEKIGSVLDSIDKKIKKNRLKINFPSEIFIIKSTGLEEKVERLILEQIVLF